MGCGSSAVVSRSSKQIDDEWQLLGYIGSGNFGEVRAAKSKQDGHVKAVKIVRTRKKSYDVTEEVRVWKVIGHHPNIIPLLRAFRDTDSLYMVMERFGRDLRNLVLDAMHTLEFDQLNMSHMFGQMLSALAHLHSNHVVHRDVKPENYLCDGGHVKLCDFGLAKIVPKSGKLFGTVGSPPYMSPEMVGSGPHDFKTDIWSLGAVCYLMLYGKRPYEPFHQGARAMKEAIARGVPKPTFQGPRTTSGAEEDFVRMLLERKMCNRVSANDALCHSYVCMSGEQLSKETSITDNITQYKEHLGYLLGKHFESITESTDTGGLDGGLDGNSSESLPFDGFVRKHTRMSL